MAGCYAMPLAGAILSRFRSWLQLYAATAVYAAYRRCPVALTLARHCSPSLYLTQVAYAIMADYATMPLVAAVLSRSRHRLPLYAAIIAYADCRHYSVLISFLVAVLRLFFTTAADVMYHFCPTPASFLVAALCRHWSNNCRKKW